jgi:lipopolysaccharide transport system ATP-binding protein
MSSEPAVLLKHLSKKYPIYDRPAHKFLELLTLRRKRFHREFWALEDVDLEVAPGCTLGIIGQNGSGKSTLLQVVAGILAQTRGDCRVNGRVAALLELGAGFNPEFTGLENVFMNGAIMGFTKAEMQRRLAPILEFAEIGDFIKQPVKTYSSGMFMRLAFSVAIHSDPDILLVDEALAVGDIIFQHRCVNRINRLRQEGKTVLFVTHDLSAVTRFCDRAILLDYGRKLEDGKPEPVTQRYQALVYERERRAAGKGEHWTPVDQDLGLQVVTTIPYIHNRFGEGGAEILGIILLSNDGEVLNEIRARQEALLVVSARVHRDLPSPIIGFTVRDRLGVEITSSNTSYDGLNLPPAQCGDIVTVGFRIQTPDMRPGSYSISPAIANGNIWEHTIEDWVDNALIVNMADTGLIYGMMRWPVSVTYNVRKGG